MLSFSCSCVTPVMHFLHVEQKSECTEIVQLIQKPKFPICPVYIKSDVSLTAFRQSCRGWSQISCTFGSILYRIDEEFM